MLSVLELMKWLAAIFFFGATLIMFNQGAAAKSTIPWTFFLIGNTIWLVDSIITSNIQWIAISIIFMIFDILLIIQRVRNKNVITK